MPTISEIHTEFNIFYDKIDASTQPELDPEEIDIFLNEAQLRFVKQRYGGNNIYGSGFEERQKRTDDLNTITKTKFGPLIAVPGILDPFPTFRLDLNSLFDDEAFASPSTDPYMFYLKGMAKVTQTNCAEHYVKVKLVQQDDLVEVLLDPFNKPRLLRPVIYFEDGDLFVVTDGVFSVTNFRVTYLKRPVEMRLGTEYDSPTTDVEAEMPEHTHKEIIQQAVQIALEVVESQRQQTMERQLQKIE